MHLVSLELDDLLDRLRTSSKPIAVIVAPNFEERSISLVKRILNYFSEHEDVRKRLWWFMITLQGDHPPQILDAVKARNAQRCWRLIEENSPESYRRHEIMPYPAASRSLGHRLDSYFEDIGEIFDLVVDYSSIPRSLLTQILNEISMNGPRRSVIAGARATFLSYTWAERYPRNIRSEFVGEIIGHYSQTNLEKLIEGKDVVDLAVFCGGNVHDASTTLELAYRSILGRNLSVNLVVFLNYENSLISEENLRNHYKLLGDVFLRDSSSVRFVYSAEDAYAFLCAFIENSKCAANPGRGFLGVAPFGPKPIGVAAHFALAEYWSSREGVRRGDFDVLTVSDAQYLSVYSLGEGRGHVFEIVRQ